MLNVFADAFGKEEPPVPQPDDAYLGDLLASDAVMAAAAVVNGEVVGGLTAYCLPMLTRSASELYIYDLAVAEANRRRGIATALVEHARLFARSRGITTIYVQAGAGDSAARAVYAQFGDSSDVVHFDIHQSGSRRANDPDNAGQPPS